VPKKETSTQSDVSAPPKTVNPLVVEGEEPTFTTGYGPVTGTLWTILAFFFAQLAVVLFIGLYALSAGYDETFLETVTESNLNNFIFSAGFAFFQLVGVWALLRYKKRTLRSAGLVRPVRDDIFRSIMAWGGYMVAFIGLSIVLQSVEAGIDFEQSQQIDFTSTNTPLELALIFVSLVVLPAFVEEILMRGFLYRSLRSKLGFVASAVPVSLLFGLAHTQFGSGEPLLWIAFVDTFVLSMVLCYVVEKYKSIWPAIGAHAIKNGLAFTYLFVI
jgi:membrane protease YdiL (CAAX protease family)